MGCSRPLEKIKITPDTERQLQESEAAVFCSAVMRLGFLALDRPDIQFGAKEAARGIARPTVRHQRMLKRCARYLLQAGTLTWCFARQRFPRCILLRSDTDCAGCPLTQRSTSTHQYISDSTHGTAAAQRKCLSAALAICQRRGCGPIRHLEAGCLWIQSALASKRVNQLTKVPGAKNKADILMKSVSRRDLDKHCWQCDWRSETTGLQRYHKRQWLNKPHARVELKPGYGPRTVL